MSKGSQYRKTANKYMTLSNNLEDKKASLSYKLLQIEEQDVSDAYEAMNSLRNEFVGELNEAYFSAVSEVFLNVSNMITELENNIGVLGTKSSEAEEIARQYYRWADEADAEEDD